MPPSFHLMIEILATRLCQVSLLLEAHTSQMTIYSHRLGVSTLTLSSSTQNPASIPTALRSPNCPVTANPPSEACGFLLLRILFFLVRLTSLPAFLIFHSLFSITLSTLSPLLLIWTLLTVLLLFLSLYSSGLVQGIHIPL